MAVAAGACSTLLCSRHPSQSLFPESSRIYISTRFLPSTGARRRFFPVAAQEGSTGLQLLRFGTQNNLQDLEGDSKTARFAASLAFINPRRQNPRTVFVAGATGQIGVRICQKLLREGFTVRAGVSDLFLAKEVAEFAAQYGIITREESKRLNAVEFDFKSVESIATAIGNAAKVVVTIGPTEDGPRSKVSIDDASQVVEAAKAANVAHIAVVYETDTGDFAYGLLANISSFFTSLFRRGESGFSALVNQILESELKYTILKASSTEEVLPTSQNLLLVEEGTLTENGKVSKTQIATVVAGAFLDTTLSENKIAELTTSSSSSAKSVDELLRAIPTDGRRAKLAEARTKAEKEEQERLTRQRAEADAQAATEEANKPGQLAARFDTDLKRVAAEDAKPAAVTERAKATAEAATAAVDSLTSKLKELGGTDFFSKTFAGQPLGGALPLSRKAEDTPKTTVTARKSNVAVPSFMKRSPLAKLSPAATPVSTVSTPKPEIRKIFGGLFKQETVYIDED